MNSIIIAIAISFVVAYLLTPLVVKYATHKGIVALPGGRRLHARPMPLMGGLAMYLGFLAAVVTVVILDPNIAFNKPTLGILLGGSFVAIVGLMDDIYELPGWFQAVSIVIGGGVLVLFGVQVVSFTNPFNGGRTMMLGALGIPVTLFWTLVVTKAVDCTDGMDGLTAGIAAIASSTLMMMALDAKPKSLEMIAAAKITSIMAAALMGAAIGFLRFNYPPAKIFMGTIGSQFLGFILAAISVVGAFKIATLVAVAAPILVLGVPLFDTAFVVLKRVIDGKRFDQADRTHLHHRLANKGFSHRQVIWMIYGITIVFCAIAYVLFSFGR